MCIWADDSSVAGGCYYMGVSGPSLLIVSADSVIVYIVIILNYF